MKKYQKVEKITTPEGFQHFIMKVQAAIKTGQENLETFMCVFQYKDDPISYICPLLEWMDLPTNKNYSSLILYQLIDEKSIN